MHRIWALALEYFHTASLIFDDLPCMDNALERPGAPCVHVAFGESTEVDIDLTVVGRLS
jgi:geranylgeranyl diphosphate synthase type II